MNITLVVIPLLVVEVNNLRFESVEGVGTPHVDVLEQEPPGHHHENQNVNDHCDYEITIF